MSLDLFAGIAGPYVAPDPSIPSLPIPTLPLDPPPAPLLTPPPAPPRQAAAPADAPGAAAPTAPAAPGAKSWWSVEHHTTDGVRHTYCGACYGRIPEFLIRESTRLPEPDESGARCEGCGDGPDLTAETVEVLGAFLAMVEAAEPYPTRESLGEKATLACLAHARTCVLLCAAARGIGA